MQLEIQTYYLMPLPGYNPEALKRNVLRAYNSAQAVIREVLSLDRSVQFLRHISHFHFRAVLSASCVIYRLIRSSYMSFIDCKAAEQSATDAIAACRLATVTEGDLPHRLGNLLEGWSDRLLRTPSVRWSEDPVSSISQRLCASVAYDLITRWKSDSRSSQPPPNYVPGTAVANPAAAGGANGIGNGSVGANNVQPGAAAYAAGTPAAPGTEAPGLMGGADALQGIDWTFMDDFDWNFEPVMPVLTAPT